MDRERIVLDFAGVKDVAEVHELLKEAFGFPDYYGKNWDALSDCLQDALMTGSYYIELRGLGKMDERLLAKCAPMLAIFKEIHAENPDVEFEAVS